MNTLTCVIVSTMFPYILKIIGNFTLKYMFLKNGKAILKINTANQTHMYNRVDKPGQTNEVLYSYEYENWFSGNSRSQHAQTACYRFTLLITQMLLLHHIVLIISTSEARKIKYTY